MKHQEGESSAHGVVYETQTSQALLTIDASVQTQHQGDSGWTHCFRTQWPILPKIIESESQKGLCEVFYEEYCGTTTNCYYYYCKNKCRTCVSVGLVAALHSVSSTTAPYEPTTHLTALIW